jgi:Xaa-Pro aminopeptidase
MMNPAQFGEMQEAIRGENLDGWLFCNFRHRDPLADEILGIDPALTNSRLWLYAVPASGEAVGIIHAVEPDALENSAAAALPAAALPGRRISYRGRDELFAALAPLAGKRWGCHFSNTITAISFLDAGTASLFEEAGLELVSAAGLLQRFKGLMNSAAMEAHEEAARHLYEIVEIAWDRVRHSYSEKTPLYEGDIQRLMLEEFKKRNLTCDHPPIVAAGVNSGNPHYGVAHNGALFAQNDVIQFDLWARDPRPGGVYADISWVGVYAETPPPEAEQAFANLLEAREGAYRFIKDELAAGRRPVGADVDRRAREVLLGFGYAAAIRHRTGHGIDTEVHGSGVNIDSVEFPDKRLLLDGACFSLEPGIYFERFGMRTEIDVYIKNGQPVISGKERQFKLLRCS